MRALVLHPDIKSDRTRRAPEFALDEAVALAAALPDLEVVDAQSVRLPRAQPGLLFGKGKINELHDLVEALDIGLVLIDGPVTPVQQRNLEKEWGCKVLDRTGLILEIFADRAATREGVLQVELAALSYQRTRLVRAWTHLERQRGGLGFVGGPGETQIEADRRAIDEAVTRIKRQLAKVVKTRALHRSARAKVPYPIVALVGYTNAGKSTLFNRLTGADVMAKDMLFATLDPTMRSVTLPDGTDVILSDTVGFISDLPTQLVAAFRATLEEVLDADLIVHVRDISHPQTAEQAEDVHKILADLGVGEQSAQLEVWNKLDLLDPDAQAARQVEADRNEAIFAISALTGEGIDEMLTAISQSLSPPRTETVLELPHHEGRKRAWLFEQGLVEAEETGQDVTRLTVRWTARQQKAFRAL
ncbi:GTPase HflX [Rhodobacteraceae bacterium N5(2021)]|uniref:GTPase HflX n=1 Tax=Gymnodinialimonas phycosphaerae TaxID=2841589 RepID=A0A975TWH0_9RHOB|nr:GTPase HflX [Gymnodinialimonas phycosphaerae]MBY4892115.1 GTPase HflX [Gymnodinialimonas phycosphaerae]